MRYLAPKADLTFKPVFGEHPDWVMGLLNALLPLEPEEEINICRNLYIFLQMRSDFYFRIVMNLFL